MEFNTFTPEGDQALTVIMRDFIAQAKMGDWTADDDWYTLERKFTEFAEKHPTPPPADCGWTDTDTMEIVVWVMRKVANGESVKELLAN